MRQRSLHRCKAVPDAVLNVERLISSWEDIPLECQHVIVESSSETTTLFLPDFSNTDGFSKDEDEADPADLVDEEAADVSCQRATFSVSACLA